MSEEPPHRPTRADGREAWQEHWAALGMPWRTEPEIDDERQRFLAHRRAVKPEIAAGIYPFRAVNGGIVLTRADVEWLLATHESGGVPGPVIWDDVVHTTRSGLDLRGALLAGVDLSRLPLTRLRGGLSRDDWDAATPAQREMAGIHCERAILHHAHLQRASFQSANLRGANLHSVHMDWTFLTEAHLEGADLRAAHLDGALLLGTHLEGVDARAAYFDRATHLEDLLLGNENDGTIHMADVRWGETNLAVVGWSRVAMLGDERTARRPAAANGAKKGRATRLQEHEEAVRANRQLAIALRSQGLNENADHFAYRAQLCQRAVLWRQRHYLRALGSAFLWLIAGYGYKPLRSVITYIAVILCFAAAYFALTSTALAPVAVSHSSPLQWYEALVLSVSSFHGRGLFPTGLSLGDPVAILAAGEAILGLLIEITFIATFTNRFFAR